MTYASIFLVVLVVTLTFALVISAPMYFRLAIELIKRGKFF